MLAWGAVEYRAAYAASGQLTHLLNNLRYVNDYFIKAHPSANVLYGQVGNGGADHAWWGPAEVMPMARPAYKIDATCGGSDLAGETAAAMAASSMVFRPTDAAYADTLLDPRPAALHVRRDGAAASTASASPTRRASTTRAAASSDELVWGAAWLAPGHHRHRVGQLPGQGRGGLRPAPTCNETGTTVKKYKWTIAWDDKIFGAYVLLAKLTGKQVYIDDANRWLDYWTVGVERAAGPQLAGRPDLRRRRGARCATRPTPRSLAFVYSDWLTGDATRKARYHDFGVSADRLHRWATTRAARSYMIGFGTNPPRNPHHRTAHGSWADSINEPDEQPAHPLRRAGRRPGARRTTRTPTTATDYVMNEVATDYNAGLTGALARMYQEFGGTPLASFPARDARRPRDVRRDRR